MPETDLTPTPDRIMQLGLGFWGSRTLLAAVQLGLFTLFAAEGPLTAEQVEERLGLHPRGTRDFLDALVALGVLERASGHYGNTPESEQFLDRNKTSYAGGILEMAAGRLWEPWGRLDVALRTGEPQNESRMGQDPFEAIYADPKRLRLFLAGMTGISLPAAKAIAEKFPWSEHRTFVDVGGAQGCVPVQLAQAHPHLSGGNFDLPAVGPVFEEYVESFGLSDRLRFYPGDFTTDPLPEADVLIMGHILHDWGLERKRDLIAKAHAALPDGGALIVYEALIDDERRENAFGLLMSLNMLIETSEGFDFTGADCQAWMREAGFAETSVQHLAGPDSMVIAVK